MYEHLSDISFRDFVSLYCDGDRSRLYIGRGRPDTPDTDAEDSAMESLFVEFAEEFGSVGENASRFNDVKRSEMERMNIVILSCAILLCSGDGITDDVKKMLKKMKIAVTGRSETDIRLLESKLAESMRKQKENEPAQKKESMDKRSFYSMLTGISVHFKVAVGDDVNMLQFCEYVRMMEESVKAQRKNARKSDGKGYGK